MAQLTAAETKGESSEAPTINKHPGDALRTILRACTRRRAARASCPAPEPERAWSSTSRLATTGSAARHCSATRGSAISPGRWRGLTKLNHGDAALLTSFTVLKSKRSTAVATGYTNRAQQQHGFGIRRLDAEAVAEAHAKEAGSRAIIGIAVMAMEPCSPS